jgi:polar amino acid transport system permease protein
MTPGWSLIWENADRFAAGALLTVELTVLTMVLAIPGGLVLAFLRLSRWRVIRFAATAFVELFRSTPLILQIYWVYYILPVFTEIRLPGWRWR